MSEQELNDLKVSGVYVAGFTDQCKDREDLYDLFVDSNHLFFIYFFIVTTSFSW